MKPEANSKLNKYIVTATLRKFSQM